MQVIACFGQLANGKDILADYLAESLNKHIGFAKDGSSIFESSAYWKRSAFASAVKETFENSFGVNREFTEQWKRNPEAPPGFLQNVRKSLQFIGDGFRQIKADIWIDIALRNENRKLVLSDGRYINEAKAVKNKDGINIVLFRPGYLNNDPNLSEAQIKPIVEWCNWTQGEGPIDRFQKDALSPEPFGIEHFDFFLRNNGTVEDLYDKIDNLLIPYIKEKYESQ